jgi:hypothetical protein
MPSFFGTRCVSLVPQARQLDSTLMAVWAVHDAGIATSFSGVVPRRRRPEGPWVVLMSGYRTERQGLATRTSSNVVKHDLSKAGRRVCSVAYLVVGASPPS